MTTLIVAIHNSANAPKTSHLILYREIIAVCSEIHSKHMNTLCGLNVELINVALGDTYSDHWLFWLFLLTSYSVII
jgi:hypothetical protein